MLHTAKLSDSQGCEAMLAIKDTSGKELSSYSRPLLCCTSLGGSTPQIRMDESFATSLQSASEGSKSQTQRKSRGVRSLQVLGVYH